MLELSAEENTIIGALKAALEERGSRDLPLLRRNVDCLVRLGEAVSAYPSVRESQTLQGMTRDGADLVDALCSFRGPSRLLHIPAKVSMARSYLVAKFQSFSLLYRMIPPDAPGGAERCQTPLRRLIFSLIHTLMAEEVYLSCLDDPGFSREIKIRVADDLIALWDSGADPRAVRHLPALEALWTVRDASPPTFGTMDGSSELMRLTMDLEGDWQEFLVNEALAAESREALEEFLFGLSYEEIKAVRLRLARFGIAAVNGDELRTYLGSKPAYAIASPHDFRALYDFYVERREAAEFRKKNGAPGPWRTLEEIYLKYRIARE